MSIRKDICQFLIHLNNKNLLKWMPDFLLLKIQFGSCLDKTLNLRNPKTFNEKLQWLKLYDRNPEYSKMVDKYEAKEYVSNIIGEEYIIPTLGIFDNWDQIDFEKLPNQFVIKCTHDSGGIAICKDKEKFDYENAKNKINKCLKCNYYYRGREWPYKNIKPRILIEKFMEDPEKQELSDYKLMCFNGKVKCSFTCTNRNSKSGLEVTFFDNEWNRLPFERHYPSSPGIITKPTTYDKMVELAEQLSEKIPFVRVDFYEVKNQLYFGEMTFYPGGGLEQFSPEQWDYTLGEWLKLPKKKMKESKGLINEK